MDERGVGMAWHQPVGDRLSLRYTGFMPYCLRRVSEAEEVTKWRYFSYESDTMLACPCCGKRGMDHSFMLRLDDLRHSFGSPMRITSGYRCPQYNRQLSTTGATGPHTTGRAVDIHLVGGGVFDLLALIEDHGFTGVGLKQKGAHIARFIHLDNLADGETKGPRPWVWTY